METSKTGRTNVEAIPAKLRWLTIATGLFCTASLAPFGLFFGIWSLPLILGAVIQPYSPRPGKLLTWFGALVLSPWVFYLSGAGAIEIARNPETTHDAMAVLLLFISSLSVVLMACCDVAMIVNARHSKNAEANTEQRFPRVGDWFVWLIAFCLTVPVIPEIIVSLRAYRTLDRPDIFVTNAIYVLLVLALDIALGRHALKMIRLRQTTDTSRSSAR